MPWIEQQLIADGVTAEGRIVVNKAILEMITNDQVLTLAVNAGGTGYVVGETFDIVGGTALAVNGATFNATGRVTAESGGVVSGIEILSSGAYSADPTLTGATTTNASAAGNDDLTVDITMQTARWTQDESDYVDLLTNFEWLGTSVKSTNAPTIGGQSQLSGANDGIRIQIASGYDSGSTWLAQPGAPPSNNFYVNLPNGDPQLYVSITERRVNFMVSNGSNHQYGGMGLFIPITDVAGNYPFPGFAHGQSTTVRAITESRSASLNSGLVNPLDNGGFGPYQYRDNLSSLWFSISNNNNGGAESSNAQIWPDQSEWGNWEFNYAPVPAGSTATAVMMNPLTQNKRAECAFLESEWFETAAPPGTFDQPQGPQPLGPGNQLHFTCVAHIISNKTNESMIIGYVDGWENVHGRGLTVFDEIATASGRRYLVFQDTGSTELWRWVAMEKL
jgi:hypothetical protein